MMIRTTKQIWQEYQVYKGYLTVSDKQKEKEGREEWVCLVDLKKQIEELMKKNPYGANKDAFQGFNYSLSNLYSESCNSSEQKRLEESTKHAVRETNSPSVSGEHNTGEDKVLMGDNNNSKSSPVQNPNGGEMCERSCNTGWVTRSGANPPPPPVQKKCTCPTPITHFKVNDDNTCIVCGGRCGGAL